MRIRVSIDTLEHMFENRGMAPSSSSVALTVDDDLGAPESTLAGTTDVVRELQARIRGMQRTTLDTRASKSKPDIGIVNNLWEVFNQKGEKVMSMQGHGMFRRRNPGSPAP